jgi:hypothetical protein
MNQITHQDFGLLKSEFLNVDYICLNINSSSNLSQIASYFQALGFNCYQKTREENKSRKELNNKNNFQNKYELNFITNIPYWNGIQVHFAGFHANYLYELIKRGLDFNKFHGIISRIDLYYDRRNQSTDKIHSQEFINSSFLEFQNHHSRKNIQVEKNQKGLVFKIGSRKSQKYYRIYTKDNFLRFEFEIKGNFIQDLQSLLLEQRFEEFEQILSYQFFKHSFKLFHSSTQSYHLDWLMDRLRPYQHRNLLTSQIEVIPSHYIKQFTFKEFQDKLDLITFFQFLVYARGLKYKADSLGSTHYRLVQLRVQDFLHYTKRSNNYYQLDKLIKFFDKLQQNSLIQVFSDDSYRGIVTIPEVNLFKTSDQSWLAEIWMAEELFTYLHPFLFNDFFQDKLTKYQFQVLFEIVKVFSSSNVRKEFNIQQFIHSYPSTLNGKLKIKIKEHFIQYLQVLENQPKIKAKVLLLPSNEIHNIHQLTYNHLRKNKTIVAFEIIDIKFI